MTVYVLKWKSQPTEVYADRADAREHYAKRPTWERDHARYNGHTMDVVVAGREHGLDAIWSDAARAMVAEVTP